MRGTDFNGGDAVKIQADTARMGMKGIESGRCEERRGRLFLCPERAWMIQDVLRCAKVLIEQITNHWCPGIWHEAMDKGATCSANRFPSWAEHGFVQDENEEDIVERAEYLLRGIGGETKEDLMASRAAKMGLPEGALGSSRFMHFTGRSLQIFEELCCWLLVVGFFCSL